VRFIGNRSSGKQGHAIAAALARLGADVTLITGPVALPDPPGLRTIHIETAAEMLKACEKALPCDIAICAAAVSDWAPVKPAPQKLKKSGAAPSLTLKENPDILKTLSHHKNRPQLVVGFAAETENLLENARAKLESKGCDWILANDVSENAFGGEANHIIWLSHKHAEDWGTQNKTALADQLAAQISLHLKKEESRSHAAQ
jgi:phosphopantothenoylcysteine decarboxylase/phosphopantothenate--cysteine ligase